MGIFKSGEKLLDLGKKIADTVDATVIDQDKALELKAGILNTIAEHMLTGTGSSITKITINGLTAMVVIIGAITHLRCGDMEAYRTFALTVTPLIGGLFGAYATATTIQRITRK